MKNIRIVQNLYAQTQTKNLSAQKSFRLRLFLALREERCVAEQSFVERVQLVPSLAALPELAARHSCQGHAQLRLPPHPHWLRPVLRTPIEAPATQSLTTESPTFFPSESMPLPEPVNPPAFNFKRKDDVVSFLPEHFCAGVPCRHSYLFEPRQEDVVKLDLLACAGLLDVHAEGLQQWCTTSTAAGRALWPSRCASFSVRCGNLLLEGK